MDKSYQDHIARLQSRYEQALSRLGNAEAVLIHSGIEHHYHADDQTVPFRAYGHFSHWLPVDRPDQLLLFAPGRRPVYFQVIPPDYWYEQSIDNADWWTQAFDIVTLPHAGQVKQHLPQTGSLAFLGEAESFAGFLEIEPELVNPPHLLHFLDYQRALKSGYEVHQIRRANTQALAGHDAARDQFLAGDSEYRIHMAYLEACEITEQECPYTSIVALDHKAAILHYQYKRRSLPSGQEGQVLLIDAGCRVNNYCSDITRTTLSENCHEAFRQLRSGVEKIQASLIAEVRPGICYTDLHRTAMRRLAELAVELGLFSCSVDDAIALNLPGLLMPHGLGHLLGVQVHDVGGHLGGDDGSRRLPPPEYPFLRNTRKLAENMVFTIEPGCYFIPLLLDRERGSKKGKYLNWSLIEALIPLGGIRIEDNVRVTADGVENLTCQ